MEDVPPARRRAARHRGLYVLWVGVVIGLGLGSRSETVALPPFVAKHAGDALWGLMIFLGFGLLLPASRTAAVAGLAAAACGAIECGQLYHAPWLDALRRTWFGRVALGDTFGWGDLAAYLVGIAFGVVGEWASGRAHRAARERRAKPTAAPDSAP